MRDMEAELNQPTLKEVVYKKARLSRRMFGYFLDIGLFILTSFILYSIINMPVTRSRWFKARQEHLTNLRNDSGLYVNGMPILDYVQEPAFTSMEMKKDFMRNAVEKFYYNPTYISDVYTVTKLYDFRRIKARNSAGVLLFEVDGDVIKEKESSSPMDLYFFYYYEISEIATPYLIQNPEYFSLVRFSFWVTVVEFIIILTVCYFFYFLVIPLLICRRGRQTLGMKMEKVGLISVRADNVTAGKYILRSIFNYFVFIPLDFVGFLIPAVISITMMYISKTNSNLPNYVFNDYAVDVTDQTIYLNALEREESEFKLQEISLENKDLRLK